MPLEDVILARTEIDFRSSLQLGETVEIGVRPSRLGTKSFELEHELRANGRVVAEAKSVLVGYDYERGESISIPERWRRKLSE
jgi:acyl-CoA thioester hydrolase